MKLGLMSNTDTNTPTPTGDKIDGDCELCGCGSDYESDEHTPVRVYEAEVVDAPERYHGFDPIRVCDDCYRGDFGRGYRVAPLDDPAVEIWEA